MQPMRPQVSIGDTRHCCDQSPSIVRPQEETCRIGRRVPLSDDEMPADHRLRGIAEPGLSDAMELPLPDDCRAQIEFSQIEIELSKILELQDS